MAWVFAGFDKIELFERPGVFVLSFFLAFSFLAFIVYCLGAGDDHGVLR